MNPLKFVIQEDALPGAKTKVIGVGGGGCNAVARLAQQGLPGVDFHVINTDVQALNACPVPSRLQIGAKVTNGLGAGSDPAVGRQAALEDTERIIELIEGAEMVFVTAGLGGGTGTGAAPVVASLAKELGALTVAVVTKPFAFEGPARRKAAEKGLGELIGTVDTVISVPNERLLELAPEGASIFESFRLADDVLRQAVQGIADIIATPGLMNRDFSDIRSIMLGMGYAMMGTASARGEKAPMEAARLAISSPLMEEGGVKGARGVLINISGSSQLGLHDVNRACALVAAATENPDVQVNFGVVLNEAMGDEVKVTVIATGFERASLPNVARKQPEATAQPPRPMFAAPTPAPPPVPPAPTVVFRPEPEPEPVHEPVMAAEPEPRHHEAYQSEPYQTHPSQTPPPQAEPQRAEEPALAMNDLDVPAFLRRDRRLYH